MCLDIFPLLGHGTRFRLSAAVVRTRGETHIIFCCSQDNEETPDYLLPLLGHEGKPRMPSGIARVWGTPRVYPAVVRIRLKPEISSAVVRIGGKPQIVFCWY
jgi:hypothetical protein